jgi:putative DNA primase/helicase
MTAIRASDKPPLEAAFAYLRARLSCIPIATDGSKVPDGRLLPRKWDEQEQRKKATWDPFKERLPTEEELRRWFDRPDPPGVAVVCGAVSGNLECLDFDEEAESIFPEWCELVEAECPGLIDQLTIIRTPKPGFHVRYRCTSQVPGNTKLAEKYETDPKTNKLVKRVLIETRGEGGYALAPGCRPECHPTGRLYEHHRGPKLSQVTTVTEDNREVLIRCAQSFNRIPAEEPKVTRLKVGWDPGDDFNHHGPDWANIIEPHGWTLVHTKGQERRWKRPGKMEPGWSATTGVCRSEKSGELFAVFSSNAAPFKGPHDGRACSCDSKFGVYALLNHGGDFSAAAKDLAAKGYGQSSSGSGAGDHQPETDEEPPTFEGTPKPLSIVLLPVPRLVEAMIPAPFRAWVADIASRGCFPLEYPAAAAIVALSSLVGRKVGICPKRHDDWLVVPNLWGAIVGPPGVQKSPPVAEAMLPLNRLVADAIEEHNRAVKEFAVNSLVTRATAKAAKEKLEKAAKDKNVREEELRELAQQASVAESEEQPLLKRYVCNDASVEKLGEILAKNPNGILIFRDELIGFLKTLDREGHENDRGFYLEGWNGTGRYTYDRIGRGTIIIPAVCVSIFGTIQPGPLRRYLRAALIDNDGLMNRFQVLVYPDPPEVWKNVDCYPNTQAKNRAYQVFKAIANLDPRNITAQRDEERNIPYLHFAPDAQDFFNEWRTTLENRLRSGDDRPLIQSHLAKYRSLMPSLALLFHLVEVVDGVASGGVTLQSAEAAAAWCDLLEAHCRRAYQAALDGDSEAALQLSEHLKASLPNPFRVRDVIRKGWSGLTTSQDVELAVGILEDRGWLKSRDVPAKPGGGRPTVEYWINPSLLKEE